MIREEVEWCPHCESENIIQWDVEKNGYEIICQHCGEKIMHLRCLLSFR
jgi:transcription elongation factor Elf1